jgi:hypothetical protein
MFLDLLIAHVRKRKIELVPHLIAHHPGDANPSGLGRGLEAGGYIDPVAEDIAVFDYDVTEIDAHAKLDPPFRRDPSVARRYFALRFDRAPYCVDDAGKFDEESIAGGLNNAAAVFLNLRIAQLTADRPQRGERAFLILTQYLPTGVVRTPAESGPTKRSIWFQPMFIARRSSFPIPSP